MLEFLQVKSALYTDPETGEKIDLRLLHRPSTTFVEKEKVDASIDMDLIAKNNMGDYDDLLRLCEANPLLSEYDFDSAKLGKIVVPR